MIEQHVQTLETCRKLKEAGFSQETNHKFWKSNYSCEYVGPYTDDERTQRESWPEYDAPGINGLYDPIAAPLLTEILEHLPKTKGSGRLRVERYRECWEAGYPHAKVWCLHEHNAAEAAALLFLALKESGS